MLINFLVTIFFTFQDNYNTYDELIKLLPGHSYLAIDYPGHGKSTQMPPGVFYYPSDVPVILRRIHKYFGWPQISILAHSLAANLSCLYAAIFPNDVDLFIALDGIKPYSKEPGEFIEKMAQNIDLFLKYDDLNNSGLEPPVYTKDILGKKMNEAYFESVDIDKWEILYRRNILESKIHPGKYYFSRDIRLKAGSLICWQHEDLKEYMKRVKCPMLVIRTVGSKFVDRQKYLEDAVRIMKKSNRNFHYVEFPGKHHGHLNEPENMVGYIIEFLKKFDNGDRNLGGQQTGLILQPSP